MNSKHKTKLAPGVVYSEIKTINLLSTHVQQATYLVTESQAIVTALIAKLDQFNGYLDEATNNRTDALNLLNDVKNIFNNIVSLAANAKLAKNQIDKGTKEISAVAESMSDLVNKLIFSTEIIYKFSQIISKRKLSNPLIPDALIGLLSKATTDANKAIALTLVALQSSYAAEAISSEAENLMALEEKNANALMDKVKSGANLTNDLSKGIHLKYGPMENSTGILALMQTSYSNANNTYNEALDNVSMVTKQLDAAQSALDTSNTQLSSYSAGLAAATAAAYAA